MQHELYAKVQKKKMQLQIKKMILANVAAEPLKSPSHL